MRVYLEVLNEVRSISNAIQKTSLIPFRKDALVVDYRNSISAIINRSEALENRKTEILDELNLLSIETTEKYTKSKDLWIEFLTEFFTKFCPSELIDKPMILWMKFMQASYKEDANTIEDAINVFVYVLFELNKSIQLKARKSVKQGIAVNLDSKSIDPFSFIDPLLKDSFLSAESKATNNTGRFISAIRCASFCELIYDKKPPYILHTKTPDITMADFAKCRYDLDIYNSLQATKKRDRINHQNNKVSDLPPLKHCLK